MEGRIIVRTCSATQNKNGEELFFKRVVCKLFSCRAKSISLADNDFSFQFGTLNNSIRNH